MDWGGISKNTFQFTTDIFSEKNRGLLEKSENKNAPGLGKSGSIAFCGYEILECSKHSRCPYTAANVLVGSTQTPCKAEGKQLDSQARSQFETRSHKSCLRQVYSTSCDRYDHAPISRLWICYVHRKWSIGLIADTSVFAAGRTASYCSRILQCISNIA